MDAIYRWRQRVEGHPEVRPLPPIGLCPCGANGRADDRRDVDLLDDGQNANRVQGLCLPEDRRDGP